MISELKIVMEMALRKIPSAPPKSLTEQTKRL